MNVACGCFDTTSRHRYPKKVDILSGHKKKGSPTESSAPLQTSTTKEEHTEQNREVESNGVSSSSSSSASPASSSSTRSAARPSARESNWSSDMDDVLGEGEGEEGMDVPLTVTTPTFQLTTRIENYFGDPISPSTIISSSSTSSLASVSSSFDPEKESWEVISVDKHTQQQEQQQQQQQEQQQQQSPSALMNRIQHHPAKSKVQHRMHSRQSRHSNNNSKHKSKTDDTTKEAMRSRRSSRKIIKSTITGGKISQKAVAMCSEEKKFRPPGRDQNNRDSRNNTDKYGENEIHPHSHSHSHSHSDNHNHKQSHNHKKHYSNKKISGKNYGNRSKETDDNNNNNNNPHKSTETTFSEMRWKLAVEHSNFADYSKRQPNLVKRMVREGIATTYRGIVWQHLAGTSFIPPHSTSTSTSTPTFTSTSASASTSTSSGPTKTAFTTFNLISTPNRRVAPNAYHDILAGGIESKWEKDIIPDLTRTFASSRLLGPQLRQSLFNVLKVYSLWDPHLGYCQGLPYYASVFLMYMNEEDSFWMLVSVLHSPRYGVLRRAFVDGFPLMFLAAQVFESLLQLYMPDLAAHFAAEGIMHTLYTAKWLLGFFGQSLPLPHLLRVWDLFLSEGFIVFFRAGMAIFKSKKDGLLTMQLDELVRSLHDCKLDASPDAFIGQISSQSPTKSELKHLLTRCQAKLDSTNSTQ